MDVMQIEVMRPAAASAEAGGDDVGPAYTVGHASPEQIGHVCPLVAIRSLFAAGVPGGPLCGNAAAAGGH